MSERQADATVKDFEGLRCSVIQVDLPWNIVALITPTLICFFHLDVCDVEIPSSQLLLLWMECGIQHRRLLKRIARQQGAIEKSVHILFSVSSHSFIIEHLLMLPSCEICAILTNSLVQNHKYT